MRHNKVSNAQLLCVSAGYANQEAGRLNMAFVFLNRYLDLTEAMDDPDAGPLENADFVDTDIPFDFTVPDAHFITEPMREEVSLFAQLCQSVQKVQDSDSQNVAAVVMYNTRQAGMPALLDKPKGMGG